jgi:hypothetical protein
MKNWKVLISFDLPIAAHILKGRLETDGFSIKIRDEYTIQVNNFYSPAIGGVKLLVPEKEYKQARIQLLRYGVIEESEIDENTFLLKFEMFSSRLPFIGHLLFEFRLLIIVGVFLFCILIPFAFITKPSKAELLTIDTWCVKKLNHNGNVLVPKTKKKHLYFRFKDCEESMEFLDNQFVKLPGLNTSEISAKWNYKNGVLSIEPILINHYNTDTVFTLEDSVKNIYYGDYSVEIENNWIILESADLKILGKKQTAFSEFEMFLD